MLQQLVGRCIFLFRLIHINVSLVLVRRASMPIISIYLFIYSNKWFNECPCFGVCVCVVYSIVIVCLPLAPSNHFDGHVTHLLCSTEIYVDIFLHVFGTFFRLLSIPSYYFYDCIIRDFNLLFLFFVFVDVIVGADDNR